jgi:hypothetical protein
MVPVVAGCRERVGIVTPLHRADGSTVKIEAPEICAVLLMTALPLSSRTRGRCEVQVSKPTSFRYIPGRASLL